MLRCIYYVECIYPCAHKNPHRCSLTEAGEAQCTVVCYPGCGRDSSGKVLEGVCKESKEELVEA